MEDGPGMCGESLANITLVLLLRVDGILITCIHLDGPFKKSEVASEMFMMEGTTIGSSLSL